MRRKELGKRRSSEHTAGANETDVVGGRTTVALPKPSLGRGTAIDAALRRRKTTRSISERGLSLKALSNLLWSACGINRKAVPLEFQEEPLPRPATRKRLTCTLHFRLAPIAMSRRPTPWFRSWRRT